MFVVFEGTRARASTPICCLAAAILLLFAAFWRRRPNMDVVAEFDGHAPTRLAVHHECHVAAPAQPEVRLAQLVRLDLVDVHGGVQEDRVVAVVAVLR